jgi:hypothetical protein
MKSSFQEYFKLNDKEFRILWDECIFAFDANILLNLYRYSENTRNELFKVLGILHDRIWLPNHATKEYFKNRLNTTGSQIKEYEKVRTIFNELLSNLGNKKRHPFISDKLLIDFKRNVEDIFSEFEQNINRLESRISNDDILTQLSELFDKKVETALLDDELEKIYSEGKIRYESDIPPGYRDGNKDNSGVLNQKFGDLVIWNEIIKKAKDVNKPIIFITDDKKDDWWLIYNGQTIGPLPFLIHEFKEKTSQSFYMYTADRFMQAANEYLKEQIEQDVIRELRDFRIEEDQLNEYFKDTMDQLSDTHLQNNFYKIASEEEIFFLLVEYANKRKNDVDSFIGLKHFVTSFLAGKGIEINHAYATLNNLNEKGVIEIYDKPIGNFLVKAINWEGLKLKEVNERILEYMDEIKKL